MRKLLALILLLALMIPSAQALTLPYAESTVLSVLHLTSAQRQLVEYLYTPVFNGQTSIDLPKKTLYDDVSAAMGALMQDYPEMFHLGKNYTIRYYQHEPQYAISVEPQYRMNQTQAADLRTKLYTQAYLPVDQAYTVEGLHDMMLQRVHYGGDAEMRHTAVGTLLYGQATCEGYAQALTLLFRMGGIPCGMISGDAVDSNGQTARHSWNIAQLGGGYTLIDATWNDQDHMGLNTHWYYGLSTAQMGKDHFPDRDQSIPACGEQINWHQVRGYVVYTKADADAAIRRLIDGEVVNLRIPDRQLYHQLAVNTHAYLEDYNNRHQRDGFYGSYSVTKSDAQQCLILYRNGN